MNNVSLFGYHINKRCIEMGINMEVKSLDDNKVVIAGVIGAVSTLVGEITSWILLRSGYDKKYTLYQLNSLMITVKDRPTELMGLILNFGIGSMLGAMIYLALRKWGHRYVLLICGVISLFMWFLWELLFTMSIEGKTIPIRPVSSYYSHLISSLAYGVSMGLMLKNFIFNKIK
ncbi:hypothetical protein [Bacillus sp. ISL-46]|uniref:hypothetical protein n=1 Tax=Bacillus sp. ISL-46 TaxID=2819129 RepID=UPI001BE7FB3C|nr:hypothetical protein [Bacillus sp. ISL-46]MBT2723001.1 hypothetical protein [Bacillus sp. ISL-46]